MGVDGLRLAHKMTASNRVIAVCLAVAASLALFAVLTAGGSTVRAETDANPTPVEGGPVVVWETAIPEDWPAGQVSHIIFTFEAFSADGGALTFALKETDDTAKFSLIPAGVNDAGNYLAQLQLKVGEVLDYERQDTYLIGVVVSTESGASTEMLLRLRITDVEGDTVSPSPTASASPAPMDTCFEAISGDVDIVRSWDSSCLSENRSADRGTGDYYSRFYTFALTESVVVTITLTSEVDTYLYLMKGSGKSGEKVAENDDIVPTSNYNSRIENQPLVPGEYTVEATSYYTEKSGDFRLEVSGLPDAVEPQVDCSTGGAVSDANENAELVADCETLLSMRDALAGTVLLNWAAETPIADWDGITVGGSPMRVTGLELDDIGLNGEVSSGMGRLSGLEVLSLSENSLSGAMPDELGSLANLRELSIDGNQLTGEIPAELGGLANLATLALSDNQLSGAIPVELGDIANLVELKLAGNLLSGCIPLALQDVADNDLALTGLDVCASDVCTAGSVVSDPDENAELVVDCETLLGLRAALAGNGLLNWGAETTIADWDGITVGGSPMRVTEVALGEKGLNGSLPTALSVLTGLEALSLSGNGLRGTIPAELGGLASLTELSIDNNQLTGRIPVELGDLVDLEMLALNDNRLSGAIPTELGELTELRSLLLANNRLSGEIPVELAALANLEELKLSGNLLSGCIPPALQDVTDNDLSLTGLEACASGVCSTGSAVDNPDENAGLVSDCNALLASRNRLAGRVSLNWSVNVPIEDWEGVGVGGSTKRVVHLVLDQKGLSGRIPAELGMLSQLSLLQLTDNELQGTIPPELGRLGKLELLILAENDIGGEIPVELDGLANLSHMSLSGNDLSGEIPLELSSLTNLRSLYLDDNRLSGGIPEELGSLPNLRFLYLDDNDLSGMIPSKLGDSRTLEVLSIDGNRLTGPIPGELGAIASLEELSLESNMLTGAIPVELGSLTKLEILSLAANRMDGEIPAQLGAIPNLRALSLHSNQFTGCIPKELQDVQRNDLMSLGLEFCGEGQCAGGTAVTNPSANHGLVSDCNTLLAGLDGLRGSAPLNWSTEVAIEDWDGVSVSGSPKRVTELNLSGKQLDGIVAPELGNLTKLKILNLSVNVLTGEIPSELVRLTSMEELSLKDNELSGQIPYELARLANLRELYVSGNELSGCIPDGLEDVEDNDLDALALLLCGEVDCSSGTAVADPEDNSGLVSDCEILLELRDELAGSAFLNWSPHVAVDSWDGITVSGSTKRVTQIELDDKGLSGEILAKLGGLSNLEVLSLADNQLSGEIPSELGGLSELTTLSLANNQLSGAIPPELGVLDKLEELKLAGNNLTGCIPESFKDVATNDFTEIGLDYCVAGECSSGTAVENPDANPGLVADCDALLAARDTLKGDGILNWSAEVAIWEWFGVTVEGSPKRVTKLEIGRSTLNGQVAPELGRLSKLSVLSLSDNRLSGEIPSELGGLTNLEELSLSENRLTGAIPSSLGNLTALERLSLSDNRLSGEIPSQLGSLVNLDHLYLAENQLSGMIPTELGSLIALSNLSLNNNRLTGRIPSEFGSLVEVRYMRISDNQLTGELPSALGSLSNLRHLYLSRNHLSGEIPSELGDLANLTYLHLSDNDLTGDIPPELGSLSNLTQLYLSRNQLSGEIPAELGSLSNLVQLYLTRNQLTGEIPSELSSLENLVQLFLSGNQLSGCIPEGLRDVANNDISLLGLSDCEAATGLISIPVGLRAVYEVLLQQAHDTPFLRREIVGLHSPS